MAKQITIYDDTLKLIEEEADKLEMTIADTVEEIVIEYLNHEKAKADEQYVAEMFRK